MADLNIPASAPHLEQRLEEHIATYQPLDTEMQQMWVKGYGIPSRHQVTTVAFSNWSLPRKTVSHMQGTNGAIFRSDTCRRQAASQVNLA